MRVIEYKRGWIKELKNRWIRRKLGNLDLSGLSYGTACRYAEQFGLGDFGKAFAFRGFVVEKNYHVVGEVAKSKDEWENGYTEITSRDFNLIVKTVQELMEENNSVLVSIGHETVDLEKTGIDEEIEIKRGI